MLLSCIDHHQLAFGVFDVYKWIIYRICGENMVISSLSFITNLRPHGPYGTTNSGQAFSIPIADSVVGFHGRAENYIDALGIHVQPIIYIYIYVPFIHFILLLSHNNMFTFIFHSQNIFHFLFLKLSFII